VNSTFTARPGAIRFPGLWALALSIPLWWAVMLWSTTFRMWFVSERAWPLLWSCLVPDLCLAAWTAYAAFGSRGSDGGRTWREGAAIGGWGYATAWTLGALANGDLAYPGAIMMLFGFGAVIFVTHAPLSPRPTRAD
jgi:hypothetical protein